MNHSKSNATFFAIVPGAGHMYLGLMRQGIEIMFLFFLTFAVSNSFHLSFFGILLPIIWFYSIFDARKKASSLTELEDTDLPIFKSTDFSKLLKSNNTGKYIAYVFILLGFLSLIDNIVLPLLSRYVNYEILRLSKELFISLIFIAVGLLIIIKGRKLKTGDNKCNKEE
ncbi:hypothetical protein KYB31_06940 [Clostridium felsineum]|uniref:hypothetical protein n=1 Tax=Clostridium felsineum TaxID=36839 RepID=UPI00214D6BBA|nr:hypothetical protein [Clostridium felsineum]MCR3758730.1 hypothetical protein [Clostridium felsineum]